MAKYSVPMPGQFGGLAEIPQETLKPGTSKPTEGKAWAEYGDFPVHVNDKSEQNLQQARDSRGLRNARRDALDHSMWESALAGLMETIPAKVMAATWYGKPEFKDDAPVDHHKYLQGLNFALTSSEREFFMEQASGLKAADWAIQRIKDWRNVRETEASHAYVAFGSAMLDPLNVMPGGAAVRFAGGVRNRLIAGAVTGATNAAIEGGIGAGPVDDDEILAAGLMSGITGMFYRARAPRAKAAPAAATPDAPQAPVAPQAPTGPSKALTVPGKVITPADDVPAPRALPGAPRGIPELSGPLPPHYWGAPRLEGPVGPKPVSLPDPRIDLRLEGPATAVVDRATVIPIREPELQVIEGPARLEAPKPEDLKALFYDKNAGAEDIAFKDADPKTSPIVHLSEEEIKGLGLHDDIKMSVEDPGLVAKYLFATANADLAKPIHERSSFRFTKAAREAAHDDSVGYHGAENSEHIGPQHVADATNDVEFNRPALPAPVRAKALEYEQRALLGYKETVKALNRTLDDVKGEAAKASPLNVEKRVRAAEKRAATAARKEAEKLAKETAKAHRESLAAARQAQKAAEKAQKTAEAAARKAEARAKAAEAQVRASEAKAAVRAERAARHAEAKAAAAQRAADQKVFKAQQAAQRASQKASTGPTSASMSQGSTTPSGMSPNAPAARQAAQHTAQKQAQAASGGSGGGQKPPAGQQPAAPATPPPGPNASIAQILAAGGSTSHSIPDSAGRTLGQKLAWNMHKTMSSWGPAGKAVADLLYDDVLNPGKVSLESERAAILSDLQAHERKFTDMFQGRMKADGWGAWKQLADGPGYYRAQRKLEQDLYTEMAARQNSTAQGVPHVSKRPDLKELADQLDLIHRESLNELKRAGVENAEHLKESSGYLSRKWDSLSMEQTIQRLDRLGMNGADTVADMLKQAIHARSPLLPDGVALEMAKAIRDRTLRKGYFEDNVGQGTPDAVKAQVIDSMNRAGIDSATQAAVLDALEGATDKATGPKYLRSRIGMDLLAEVKLADGSVLRPVDLLDTSINRNVQQYLMRVSTDAALARKGLGKTSDVMSLREHLLHNVAPEHRRAAAEQFDATMAYYKGLPAGESVNENFRRFKALGSMAALAASGLWQITEMATAMGRFGLGASVKIMARQLPGFKQLFAPQHAEQLAHLLSEHSARNIRMQPFLRRWEDMHNSTMGAQANRFDLFLEHGQNLTPYLNGMKYVHHMQAKLVGNLMTDALNKAMKGNKKARKLFADLGIDDARMQKLEAQWKQHGLDIDAWDDATWDAVRPAFIRGMDDFVLKQRMGGTPAFVAFNPVGKVLFTYRNFVLAAHNQILAQNLAAGEGGALILMMLYQYPLAVLATAANDTLRGKDDSDPLTGALGQMGALGLLSEPVRWMTGQSNSLGAPVLLPADSGIKFLQAAGRGEFYKATGTAVQSAPLLGILPGIKGLGAAISNMQEEK